MAAPSYTTDLTTIATGDLNVDTGTWDESSDGGWDTGGAMVDDQNLYYNNTECVSAQMTKDSNGSGTTGPATIMYVHGSTFTIPTDGAVLLHHLWAAPPALNTLANGGVKTLLGNGLGDFSAWNCSGSDFKPAPKGGWTTYALNPAVGTADDTVGTGASSPYTTVGGAVGATAQARGNPHACNAVRYGRCTAIYTLGDLGNGYATFLGFGLVDSTTTNKWSLLDPVEGGYSAQGLMSFGVTATAVDFRDANRNITIANTINVTSAFNRIEVHHADSNVEWTAVSITALGTVSPGQFEMIDNATVAMTSCTFTDMGTFIFLSNATLLNTTFRRGGQVTHGGADFENCVFEGYEGTADTAYLNYAVATDASPNIDGCSFTKGTASTHAIEFDATNTPTTITLTGMDFSGYNASDDQTDSTLHFASTTKDYTVNLSGCTGNISYSMGAGSTGSVTFVSDPVTLEFTVKDGFDGSLLSDARVLVWVTSGANFTYQGSVTNLTGSGTLCTATHAAHGYTTNDYVFIEGANEDEYNGVHQITVNTTSEYEYTIAASVSGSPATGTITSTYVMISGLTIAGVISASWELSSDQPFSFRVRKSTTSPFFIGAKASDTITTVADKDITVQLTRDE